jgi:hypothetical protein
VEQTIKIYISLKILIKKENLNKEFKKDLNKKQTTQRIGVR